MSSQSATHFLQLKWQLTTDRLEKLKEEWAHLTPATPTIRQSKEVPEWVGKAQRLRDEFKVLIERYRLIEKHLGNHPKTGSGYVEFANYLDLARWVRASIQNGESDEFIAAWLMGEFPVQAKTGRLGRPQGTINHDGHALLALELYDGNPRDWPYPKLADRYCPHKHHKPHAWDSECTANLKKSVEQLRKSLRELGYDPTVK